MEVSKIQIAKKFLKQAAQTVGDALAQHLAQTSAQRKQHTLSERIAHAREHGTDYSYPGGCAEAEGGATDSNCQRDHQDSGDQAAASADKYNIDGPGCVLR
jgi:hypothetical protein